MSGGAAIAAALVEAVTGTRHDVETVALGGNVYRHTLTPQPPPLSASLIGARIKRARKALGWSPGRAADAAGLALDRYRSVESGEGLEDGIHGLYAMSLCALRGIAAAFGVPLSDLTGARA